ncbi:uroporphyrinogen-III C-methyltransferase [Novosphingopyxis sp.]|uniref:uroporphyrinogen-III C-methyltransferase n=1 Tax=Novosphingopyxis sp. TaxID=2709690 RepID=UPI003B5AAB76
MTDTISCGTVYLVGAGPGDPELLTLKAARLISAAKLIVHDGLVADAIMAMARPDARLVSVAKQRARHTLPQEDINALLIAEARTGHDVVRLKGGDPFVFGRGGEEAEQLRAAGVPVEVVPGISAANGCAAEALLPLTHREDASAVSFVAGQCKGLSDQNWAGLAGKGRTLVIYMGVATAHAITEKLIADGLSPDTPVAVLENGTRGGSRAIRTLLTDLGDMIAREGVKSPALIVMGDVVKRSNALNKFNAMPFPKSVRAEPVEARLSAEKRPSTSSGLVVFGSEIL